MAEYLAKYKIEGYHHDPAHNCDEPYTKEKEVRFPAQTDEEAVRISKNTGEKIHDERREAAFRGGFSVHSVDLESLFEIRELDLKVLTQETR